MKTWQSHSASFGGEQGEFQCNCLDRIQQVPHPSQGRSGCIERKELEERTVNVGADLKLARFGRHLCCVATEDLRGRPGKSSR